jgi:FKBP-type peptidyl-prolyl cis-trans isomerase
VKPLSSLKLATIVSAGVFFYSCNVLAKEETAKLDLENTDNKTSYAIGVAAGKQMTQNFKAFEGTAVVMNKEIMIQAFADGLNDTSQMDDETRQQVLTDFQGRANAALQEKRKLEQAKVTEENKVKGAAFLEANKVKEGVVALDSGLQYMVVKAGNGKSPTASDRVKVHYTGTLADGTKFDSSVDRGKPATFGVTQVIKGWTEALQLMKEGAKWKLFIPADLAYGSISRPKIPGNSVLVFDVELIEVISPETK